MLDSGRTKELLRAEGLLQTEEMLRTEGTAAGEELLRTETNGYDNLPNRRDRLNRRSRPMI